MSVHVLRLNALQPLMTMSKLSKRRGAGVVEYVFVLAFFFIILALVLEVGRAIITYQTANSAAFAGARKGIVTSRTSNIAEAKKEAERIAKSAPFTANGKTICTASASTPQQNAIGFPMEVTVTCTLQPVFSQLFLPNWTKINLTKKIRAVMEDV